MTSQVKGSSQHSFPLADDVTQTLQNTSNPPHPYVTRSCPFDIPIRIILPEVIWISTTVGIWTMELSSILVMNICPIIKWSAIQMVLWIAEKNCPLVYFIIKGSWSIGWSQLSHILFAGVHKRKNACFFMRTFFAWLHELKWTHNNMSKGALEKIYVQAEF